MDRKEYLKDCRRVVIKIGSSSIMRNGTKVSRDFMEDVAEQVRALRDLGKEVLIVSSGAIPIGLRSMGVVPKTHEMPIRQAAASVGQGILMREWSDCFQRYGMLVGQVLMTMDTYSDRESALNLNNTVNSLLDHGVVPIFNENDAICTQQIRFGDNDTLSAIVASRLDADLLVILSDVRGLYDDNPAKNPGAKLIPVVENIEEIESVAGDAGTSMGTGGMKTKVSAAKICRDSGCDMIIALSGEKDIIYRTVTGEDVGTIFLTGTEISKKRRWIKAAHPSGRLVIDSGAANAVLGHRSLLPVGIRSVEGSFSKGDVVTITCGGSDIAKGTVSYSSDDLKAIAGRHSADIESVLGRRGHSDAVQSENIALL